MKLQIKADLKTIFKTAYIAVLVMDIVAIYYLYAFLNDNVFKTITSDSSLTGVPSARLSDDINTEHFDRIVEIIRNKSRN